MSEIRVGATVFGTGGELGTVEAVVIDPTEGAVTHLVVGHELLGPRVLVELRHITVATPDAVTVALDSQALRALGRFDEPGYNTGSGVWTAAQMDYEPGSYFLEPFASPLDTLAATSYERIPKGEVTIRRHDEVYSNDGTRVGHVDEFLVDPADGHISHVVLREGHVFAHDRDVVVPLGGATIEEGRVVLGLALPALHELERIPVTRHGHVAGPAVDPKA